MSKSSNHIEPELVARYFAGEVSRDEKLSVESWIRASRENQEVFEQFQIIWSDMGTLRSQPDEVFDVDVAWERVQAKRKATVPKDFSFIWKIAASVVILFGIGWYFISGDNNQVEFITQTAISSVALTDGSQVTLNQNSQLIYPESFDEEIRKVELKGEAFFAVKHDPEKPFLIKAAGTTIQVLGTSFNVKTTEAGDVSVSVETGKVLFTVGETSQILVAGEKVLYEKETRELVPTTKDPTGADQFWRTRSLSFTGEKLPEIIEILENQYGVTIRMEQPELANCGIAVAFENENIANVLEIIALTLDLKVTQSNNHYLLSGKGCPQEPS